MEKLANPSYMTIARQLNELLRQYAELVKAELQEQLNGKVQYNEYVYTLSSYSRRVIVYEQRQPFGRKIFIWQRFSRKEVLELELIEYFNEARDWTHAVLRINFRGQPPRVNQILTVIQDELARPPFEIRTEWRS